MEFEAVSYRELGASALLTDYVEGQKALQSFYDPENPFDYSSFQSFTAKRFGKVSRENLVQFLLEYNQGFTAGKSTIESIQSLQSPNSYTIVTGQQACFLGGPAYSFYKTLTVIALSRYLKEKADLNIVPVFWIADEDHDHDEINHIYLPDFKANQSNRKFSFRSLGDLPFAAGDIKVNEEAERLLSEIGEASNKGSAYAESLEKLHDSWQSGKPWVKAFGAQMMQVFGRFGLVLAGSNHPKVKQLCRPVFEKVLTNPVVLRDELELTSAKLAQNWKAQVAVTDSLLFYHDPAMGRIKIPFSATGWKLPGRHESELFTEETVQNLPDSFFARLSPNALLRPVVQQYLLPNIAYAGGAAELAYHGQLKTFFRCFGLDLPVLLPRFSTTVVEQNICKTMAGMPFPLLSYKKREEELLKSVVLMSLSKDGLASPVRALEKWKAEHEKLYRQFFEGYAEPDSSLETSLNSSLKRAENAAEQFIAKVMREKKKKEKVAQKRILKVKEALFPSGVLQERTVGWAYYYSMYGDTLLDDFLNHLSEDTLQKIRFHHISYI
ncbi:bacillithiol biosynthesis cysteine-adding enzyme BshC [Cyclonatronum proteinivorum]|uniref:Putative cysteine ligase BshC n=1 Tax=Cyclonatronum proteinivorum TaxID=1457365 RepID=A0A345UKX1_9BACT|nr:bacillithiol biosynthesis cysteine-adding enzyme BshC [Cyclonatronum proteinivorum]AXJ01123.1 bacillithiol biosynthesis cysteine-adding enzyme BshC [Cyclonatronum proteinivorum]